MIFGIPSSSILLVATAALIYVVARSLADVLLARREATAGRLAVAHAAPVAAVAWAAAGAGEAGLALGATLGSAVAGLAMVGGVALTGGPPGPMPASARAWPFVLPVALLLLLIGFGASINATHAAMLLLLGVVIAGVWNDPATAGAPPPPTPPAGENDGVAPRDPAAADRAADPPTGARARDVAEPTGPPPASHDPSTFDATPSDVPDAVVEPRDRLRGARLALTLLLAAFAGLLAVRAAVEVAASRRGLSPGVVGVTVLSAVLALPAVGTATLLSRTGRTATAVGMQVGTALLALCAVLPGAVGAWAVGRVVRARGDLATLRSIASTRPALTTSASTSPTTFATVDPPVAWWADPAWASPLPFPVGFWRVETVVLVALALPLVPVALGRWRPGRLEGTLLLVAYALYLLAVTVAGDRWH